VTDPATELRSLLGGLPEETQHRARPFRDRESIDQTDALLERVKPCFSAAGIARVGEVTGLDRIGIPVALAVRPNARTLSVSQGKGLRRDQAVLSAVMEALELSAAESLPASLRTATLPEMSCSAEVLDLGMSTRCRMDRLRHGETLAWIPGYELSSGRRIEVPWALVGVDYRLEPPGYHSAFQVSTDGLASGRSEDEAILHGLCELIERDASALIAFTPAERLADRMYEIDDADVPEVIALKGKIEAAGCSLTVLDMTTDIGLPAFTAIISDAATDGAAQVMQYAHSGGSACHPVRSRALVKAIVEAAQSRITRITGSRDDFPPSLYQATEGAERRAIVDLTGFAGRPLGGAIHKQPERADAGTEELLQLTLAALRERGIDQVVAVPIPNPYGIAVARVIVPGLQTEIEGARSKLGRRALAKLLGVLQ